MEIQMKVQADKVSVSRGKVSVFKYGHENSVRI